MPHRWLALFLGKILTLRNRFQRLFSHNKYWICCFQILQENI
jgi:hypothetical protein